MTASRELTELEAFKACLLVALKKDCDQSANYGAPYGKKLPKSKYNIEHQVALLAVRYPNLAEALK